MSLSVTNSASAPDRCFSATLLHACVIMPKSHPFDPAHARCGDLSSGRFTDPHAQRPQPLCACISPCWDIYDMSQSIRTFWLVFERVDEKLRSPHPSADWPLPRMRGWFLRDNAAIPPAYQVKVHNCASFVAFLEVCKFTTFCDRKGYRDNVMQIFVS